MAMAGPVKLVAASAIPNLKAWFGCLECLKAGVTGPSTQAECSVSHGCVEDWEVTDEGKISHKGDLVG